MDTIPFVLTWEAGRLALSGGEGEMAVLALGPDVLAGRHWQQNLPNPLQLERAIDDVEGAIEQSGVVYARRDRLRIAGLFRDLVPQLLSPGAELSRDEIEAEFSKLVSAAHRGPGSGAEVALPGEHAAALLILRELMHHLGFQSLTPLD